MHYTLYPRGTCSVRIDLDVEDGRLHNVAYLGGCSGNLQAIGKLVEGRTAEETIRTLKGIRCGGKPTSCGDQLAVLLEQALKQKKQEKQESAGQDA